MKKIFKSFTFYFMLASLLTIYSHYIGRDPKSIVLIYLNPILKNLCYTPFADKVIRTGVEIQCNTISGSIFINWYIAHFITFALYGLVFDVLRIAIKRFNNRNSRLDNK